MVTQTCADLADNAHNQRRFRQLSTALSPERGLAAFRRRSQRFELTHLL